MISSHDAHSKINIYIYIYHWKLKSILNECVAFNNPPNSNQGSLLKLNNIFFYQFTIEFKW